MNKNKLIGIVAVLSAGLASICCIGPLLVAALGLGSLGLAAGLAKYRVFFLALTAAILAVGFYLAYRKRAVVCPDGSCELSSGSRTMKAGLWLATILAAAVGTFPNWSARALGSIAIPADAQILAFQISGMDCAACTVEIRKAVEKVPGVSSAVVDFDSSKATVVTNGKTDPEAVLKAVTSTGYKAVLLSRGSDGKPE